ncbi:MAG TPA: Hsp70 family protein, partial [Myxococcaceae bacterium]|nr:Hsp70 family protein [Myxococcaceae bacterium]
VSVLEVFQGVREVRATAGNTALGGDDFDERLVRVFLEALQREHAFDARESPQAMARLRRAAESAKIRLSADTQVAVREEFLATHRGQPIHLALDVTRRQLEGTIQPLLDSTLELCRRALADAGVDARHLHRVCLVGGSTRIPRVRAMLEEAFGVEVHQEIDPDLAVGLGAAVQAGLLKGARVERILVDVASRSLGIRVRGPRELPFAAPETFAPVLRRNTALPAVAADEFYTEHDEQERLDVQVFQGESRRVSENTPVGSFSFPLEPRPAGSPVRVEFAYDLNGVVRVSVSQPGTANAKTVALSVTDGGGSAVQRKARALLPTLREDARARLEVLLRQLEEAGESGREEAEDALLDFFTELEAGGAS